MNKNVHCNMIYRGEKLETTKWCTISLSLACVLPSILDCCYSPKGHRPYQTCVLLCGPMPSIKQELTKNLIKKNSIWKNLDK